MEARLMTEAPALCDSVVFEALYKHFLNLSVSFLNTLNE